MWRGSGCHLGEWHRPQAPEGARRPGGARRGPAITGMVNRLALAAVLVTGLTVTACSASAPASNGGSGAAAPAGQGNSGAAAPAGQGNSAAAAPAGQSGEDPGCQVIASQASGINSQISADSGDVSAQLQVWQAWYNDLQAARQKPRTARSRAHSGTPPPALGKSSLMSRTC